MNNQAVVIANILRDTFPKTRARLGIFFQSDADVLERILLEPHAAAVLCESFHPLNRARKKAQRDSGGKLRDDLVFAETRFDRLPISPRSVDALILLGGLVQCDKTPSLSLKYLRSLLRPEGLLIWPQPLNEGLLGKAASIKYPTSEERLGATDRAVLTRLAMEAGFIEIGQIAVQQKPAPWIITIGRAPSRPWE